MRTLIPLFILGCQPRGAIDTAGPVTTIGTVSATCAPDEESILIGAIDGSVFAVTVSGDFGDAQETIPWSSWSQIGDDLDVACLDAYPLVTAYVAHQ